MKLDEIFKSYDALVEDSDENISATERYIVDWLVAMKASGANKIYIETLEKDLDEKSRQSSNSILSPDREFLVDFLKTLDIVGDIKSVRGKETGKPNFEISFSKINIDTNKKGDEEKDKNTVSSNANKAMDSQNKQGKDAAKAAADAFSL
jgi:hypothetical protein